ncbi:MAG: lytic transglycosylase domain-containing protein [Bacteroidales bacterium]|nr:lytic transglycosylase domain-containing protein [Bacteroidales bacterium]
MGKKAQKITDVVIIFILICISLIAFSFFKSTKSGDTPPEYKNDFHKRYSIYALALPDSLTFADEEVPLQNIDVREALDKELLVNTYWQSHTILLIKRANKYFPIIEPILKQQGLPNDFKYLAVAESDLTNAISPSNAVGVWQFLEATGKEYGLEIGNEVDERYHLEKSTIAACKYFRESYAKYKNWTLVAASYNMGKNGLDQQLEKQLQDSYYDLLLNDETSRYVYRILALKLILTNPVHYGFKIDNTDMYNEIPSYEVEIDSSIENIAEFAKVYNTNYKIIKKLNPWLRNSALKVEPGEKYTIKIPLENGRIHQMMESHLPESDTSDLGSI